jgi:hypothetical protein
MKRILLIALFTLLGFIAGFVCGVKLPSSMFEHDYTLLQDIDLDSAYFFKEKRASPISGILHKGSTIKVHAIRKGNAIYVDIPIALSASKSEIDRIKQ